MATGKALDGKPYAGNPHVRFDEGEVAPAATPRRGSLLYSEIVTTEKAPKALGPYSQAIKAGGFVWCSGQIPIDPAVNAVTATTIEGQTRQAITNLKHVLEAAGVGLDAVVKTTVFISDMNDFAALNAVYAEMFGDTKPARSCVQVARLPKDVKLEIEAVAKA